MSRLCAKPLFLLLLLPCFASAFLLPFPRASIPSRSPSVLLSSVEGADYPSDTADPEPSPEAREGNATVFPSFTDEGKVQLREKFKCQIYKAAARLNRGQLANLDQQVRLHDPVVFSYG